MKFKIKFKVDWKEDIELEGEKFKVDWKEDIELEGEKFKVDCKEDIELEGENFKEAVAAAIKSNADLSGANLSGADLVGANLRDADLSNADLSGAVLRAANLRNTNLSGADLDFSAWPLWCGSLDIKIDKRLFVQFLYHAARAGKSVDDPEVAAFLKMDEVKKLVNQFHRVKKCGEIK